MTAAEDAPGAQTGPEDWGQLTVMVVRDRSPVGWHLLREKELTDQLREQRLVAAFRESSGRPDLAPLRLAVRQDGAVAVADADGQVQPGPEVPEVISALAKAWNTIILVDDRVAIGPQGEPIEEVPASVLREAPNTRHIYAWPDKDLTVVRTVAAKLGAAYTTYEHGRDGWLVLASDFAPEKFLSHPMDKIGARHPFVRMARSGEERTVTYVAAKGAEALHLHLDWAPALTKVVPDRTRGDSEVAGLARWLTSSRAGAPELEPHPGMPEDQRRQLQSALDSTDGATFLSAVARALDCPPELATLAEAPPESPDPLPVGERIEPATRLGVVGQTLGDLGKEEPAGNGPGAIYERWVRRHPGAGLALGAVALAVAVALLVSLFLDVIDGVPWWVRVPIALGLLYVGFGTFMMAVAARFAPAGTEARESAE